MAKKLLISGTVVAGLAIAGTLLNDHLKTPKTYDAPPLSEWRPDGPRHAAPVHPVLGINDTFRSLHASTRNSDEVLTATAPNVELDWVVEKHLFITEGPSIDRQGNLYFSPVTPSEPVVLVSLDGETGERRWSITGKPLSQGGGTPLVLEDPDNPGQQIIYLTLYERALAVRQDGSVIWDVPTGLREPALQPGDDRNTHNFGASYHPQSDSIVGLLMDGSVFALDRKTGQPILAEAFTIPGAPAKGATTGRPGKWVTKRTDKVMKKVFGEDPQVGGRFSKVADVLFGGGVKIANYFSIDPMTGRFFIAATAPDEADGTIDGLAENGALYGIDMVPAGNGQYRLEVAASTWFKGGTGSTPALRADGTRVYVSDDNGNVIAFDQALNELWRQSVGEQILASITVASENNELYAITAGELFKLKDRGDKADVIWRASLDMYPEVFGQKNLNMLTASITANGIAVILGAGFEKGTVRLPVSVGVGLLDRETGEVISYTEGVEESVATTITGPDGGFYIAHSPIRRAVSRALLGPLVKPLTGGIARYKPVRNDLLVRDAVCAAAIRLENAARFQQDNPASSEADTLQAGVLLKQASQAATAALEEQALDKSLTSHLKALQLSVNVQNPTTAAEQADSLCTAIQTASLPPNTELASR
ncbi:hypothetical protein [Kistimonas asteriae]|uniref:hypothetical protein n=1 Tax=Kistimonas asteriae TaxID=517724 RepID=UPI001BA9ED24|nr:hypothetical protein [Kistimonas asteriae]